MQRLTLFFMLFSLSFLSAGPISELYLTAWCNGGVVVVKGSSIVRSWATSGNSELAIAVDDTVRTYGYYTAGSYGAEYTLSGTFTGTTYALAPNLGFHDGTTDGTYNYAMSWHTQTVYRFSNTWSSAQAIFQPKGGYSMLGITYDPTDNTLWLLSYGYTTNRVEHYSMAGTLLSTFNVASTAIGALAMDHADHTLWYWDYNSKMLRQYSTTGTSLQTMSISGGDYWGGEFAFVVPEPLSGFMLLLSILFIGILRKK